MQKWFIFIVLQGTILKVSHVLIYLKISQEPWRQRTMVELLDIHKNLISFLDYISYLAVTYGFVTDFRPVKCRQL